MAFIVFTGACGKNETAPPDESNPSENPVSVDPGTSQETSESDPAISDSESFSLDEVEEESSDETTPDTEALEEPSAAILSFGAHENCVIPRSTVTLTWETENAESVYLNSEEVELNGSIEKTINKDTTYTLTVNRGEDSKTKAETIYVKQREVNYTPEEISLELEKIEDVQASQDGTLLMLANGKPYLGSLHSSFSQLNPNSSVSQWNVIAIKPEDSSVLYVGTTGRLYRSTDGGSSWPDVIPVRRNNTNLEMNVVAVSAADSDKLFIGFSGGAYWVDLSQGSLELLTDLNSKEVRLFTDDEERMIVEASGDLYLSDDRAATWKKINAKNWGALHAIHLLDGLAYAATEKGIYVADPQDFEWEKFSDLSGEFYDVLVRSELALEDLFLVDLADNDLLPTTRGVSLKKSILYAIGDSGIYRVEDEIISLITDISAFRLVENDGVAAFTDDTAYTIEKNVSYSKRCPNQSRILTGKLPKMGESIPPFK